MTNHHNKRYPGPTLLNFFISFAVVTLLKSDFWVPRLHLMTNYHNQVYPGPSR